MSRFNVLRTAIFVLALDPLCAHAQNASHDTATAEDRFWGRSGGFAREVALGAGGFGMLSDSAMLTMAVNPYSVDPSFMLMNPAYASQYSSYLWLDLGASRPFTRVDDGLGQSFGGTFAVTDEFTGGLILARNDAISFSAVNPNIFSGISALSRQFSFNPPNNTWELMGALHEGIVDYGLGVSYESSAGSVTGVEDTSVQVSNFHQFGLNAGLIVRDSNGLMFDLGATALLPSLASGTGGTGKITGSALGVNARAFLPVRTEFYIVPFANYYRSSGSSTFVGTPQDLPSSSNIDAGIGVNFWQGAIHVMAGVSGSYYHLSRPGIGDITPQLTTSQTIVPRWNIGAEWQILSWLVARGGYFASNSSQKTETLGAGGQMITTTVGSADLYSPLTGATPSGVTLGAGFHIARFTIDVTVNDEALRQGLSNVSFDPFGVVTLSYRFAD